MFVSEKHVGHKPYFFSMCVSRDLNVRDESSETFLTFFFLFIHTWKYYRDKVAKWDKFNALNFPSSIGENIHYTQS